MKKKKINGDYFFLLEIAKFNFIDKIIKEMNKKNITINDIKKRGKFKNKDLDRIFGHCDPDLVEMSKLAAILGCEIIISMKKIKRG